MRALNKKRKEKHTTKSKMVCVVMWASVRSKSASYVRTDGSITVQKRYGALYDICHFSDKTTDNMIENGLGVI